MSGSAEARVLQPHELVRDALRRFLDRGDGAQEPTERFLWLPISGPLYVPFPNPGRLRQHDLHHLALGVGPTLRGEIVVSVLELYNGPPSATIALLCVAAVAIGLCRWPLRTLRLFPRLRGCKAVYHADPAELHPLTVGALRARLGLPERGLDDPFWCGQ